MPIAVDQVASFVPGWIKNHLASQQDPRLEFAADRFSAAVLFADISGFTPLSRRLAERGPEGAETLNRILSAYYSGLVQTLHDHGGDVVAFAGDAVFVLWPLQAESQENTTLRVVQCGLEIQKQLGSQATQQHLLACGLPADLPLELRISVALGNVLAAQVGGVAGAWQLVVAGEPLEQLRVADKHSRVGELVLSPAAAAAVQSCVHGETAADGHFRPLRVIQPTASQSLKLPNLSAAAEAQLSAFVPQAVLSRLAIGHGEFMSELRRATVTFLNLVGLTLHDLHEAERLQSCMVILQTAMQRYEGTLVQLLVDDKGTVAIACFGLPPYTHEDDAERAIRAAELIQCELAKAGLQAKIGISTGRIFCGPRGSDLRREYSVTGEVVNLAARLMQQSTGEILCEGETEAATKGRRPFCRLPSFVVKGFAEPIPVFRPRSDSECDRPPLIGRTQELQQIEQFLDAAASGEKRCLVIQGEAGIGKSSLMEHLVDLAPGRVQLLLGACSSIERQTPYYPWRLLIAQLLGLQDLTHPTARRNQILSFFAHHPHLEYLAPLLNPLLGVDFAESELVSQLSGRVRAENLHRLLVAIVQAAPRRPPLLIVLEDVQWQDSASWKLLSQVMRQVDLSLAIATRPLAHPEPEEYLELRGSPLTTTIVLDVLPPEDLISMACDRLGVRKLSPELMQYVIDHSQGNPFFADEMIKYLRDAGLIVVVNGICQLPATSLQTMQRLVPNSVRDLITSRIDQLGLRQQLTLKTASVIGRQFSHGLLYDIYPVAPDKPTLTESIDDLRGQDLIRPEPPSIHSNSIFKHMAIQQTAYDELPVAQRKPLHQHIAEWYEVHAPGTPANYPLMAHHWGKAEVIHKEIEYLAESGENALRDGANLEAVKFFDLALQRHQGWLTANSPSERDVTRRGHWQRLLGEALFQLGNLAESRCTLEQALETLGFPVPLTKRQLLRSSLVQVAVQGCRRVCLRHKKASQTPAEKSRVSDLDAEEEASLAEQRLAQIHYFTNEIGLGTNRALTSLNRAERRGHSFGLARSYANMCIVSGLLRWRRLARQYASLANSAARESNHLPSIAYASNVCNMYFLGSGNWGKVHATAEECISIAETLADHRLLGEAVCVLAMLQCFQADFVRAQQSFQRLTQIGLESGNSIHQAWGWSGQGECLAWTGTRSSAITALQQAELLLQDRGNRTEEIRVWGLLADLAWRSEHEQTALEYAARARDLVLQALPATASSLEGIAGTAQVYLYRWRKQPSDREAQRHARSVMEALGKYARVYPIGRPRYWRLRGMYSLNQQQPRRAQRWWLKSLSEAQRRGLPLDAALTHLQLAQELPSNSPKHHHHLQQAQQLCQQHHITSLLPHQNLSFDLHSSSVQSNNATQ